DANGNYVPDCNLQNPQANGECGRISNLAFGTSVANQTYDPALLQGWGVRQANYQASASLQRELHPGVGLAAGYFRTWYRDFPGKYNVAVSASDFTPYCITLPSDSRLPGGGGNQICGFHDITPAAFGRSQTVVKRLDDPSEVSDSFDISVNARFANK